MASDDGGAAFRAKYGDLAPKPRLIARDVKHFDSADWAMRKSLDRARAGSGDEGGEGQKKDATATEDSASRLSEGEEGARASATTSGNVGKA